MLNNSNAMLQQLTHFYLNSCQAIYFKYMQTSKAFGHGGICATLLKLAKAHLNDNLCELFNRDVFSNCFPFEIRLINISVYQLICC